ncbi:site-specific integrase [Uliginosibacterium sp. TH139]|uniref:tyrosine-type recombinase/integrase n=1 Tax=Uliginosibacterium sp. TH139 TaxID=2067453 RepID=UPI000C7E72E5|nr:site-specific integrase [Uliginosibacterium sp. TH139]PLK49966.1 preprotein translocase [Uliginosibacterium sp. TH139]
MARSKSIKLTGPKVEKATCEAGKAQTFLWDSTAPGLALRVTQAGGKAYIFQSRFNGNALRITIGDPRAWSLDNAQAEARRLQTLCDQGIDPRQQKAEKVAAAEAARQHEAHADAPALEAWQHYCTERAPKWGEAHKRDHATVSKEGGQPRSRGRRKGDSTTTQPGILRPLLLLPLSRIDASLVRDWLKEEAAKRPTHARLALNLLRAFLNWCAEQPDYQPFTNANACPPRLARDTLPKKAAKDDCLQKEQLPAWFAKVQAINNPVIATYLQVALLTGARRGEVAGIRWQDVDFQWQTLTIRDKIEGERTIPLTPYIAHLLRNLKARSEIAPPVSRRLRQSGAPVPEWKPSEWVFYSPTAESGRLQEPRIQHNKACAAAGIEGMTIHGLRRSFGTLAEWVECPAGVVAQIQGHKPSATAEKHYRRRPIDLLRMWHAKIESWVLEQAGIEFDPAQAKPGLRAVSGM